MAAACEPARRYLKMTCLLVILAVVLINWGTLTQVAETTPVGEATPEGDPKGEEDGFGPTYSLETPTPDFVVDPEPTETLTAD